MSRVLITGSSTGLGFMAGQLLVEQDTRSFCMRAIKPGPTTRAGHSASVPARSLINMSPPTAAVFASSVGLPPSLRSCRPLEGMA
jgi:hypothetical protein